MDKYDVIKVIGEGAFGKAYLAKGKSDSKHCVIKEINFAKILSWFVQISLGLKHIHDRKILHRDIKTQFEGNNLHQLALKICQAHFAPVSPRFSCDLRSLVSQLFKVSPQDRPSINSILKRPFLENLIAKYLTPEIKMVERPKHAGVCGHYDYYYAQLDLLRKRYHEPHYHCVPHEDTRVKENYSQEESSSQSPGQWPAEYLQRKFEAQQYKLKVEKQLGLRPSSAEPNHRRQELRSNGEEPRFQELPFRRNKMKEQEYWKQLEEIRQQYHNDMKEIRKKMGSEQEDIERDLKKIRLQNIKESKIPEQKYKAKRGVKFEINLDKCISDENILEEEEAIDMLNETLTFEDGMKLKENKCIKEHEDYTDEALEKLCSEAELFIQDAAATENRRQWDAGAPQTLLQMMAAADVTSTCSTRPEGEFRSVGINHQQEEINAPNAASVHHDLIVLTFNGQVMAISGIPENRKQWRHEAPETLMNLLAAAHLTSSSFSAKEGEFVRTLKQWLPKENEGTVEMASGMEVDEEQPEPRDDDDDDDTNFEESEDELRNEVVESLEKLTTSKEEGKKEEVSGSSEDTEKLGEIRRMK
ncbi:Serine/threonine-protein kinase Nek5 [Myotis brandtii]|uniref:non-specific serine/threonine protein kinase n=1 Tax=Myotis brandtii TaxID=109478 RepID=S7Q0P9_MYOBR|nr:Serine/threonine-protein kinase Nek5 [Myotis brandtii]